MRTDRGTEFLGDFDQYCASMGIRRRIISTAWPRAQGQIERMNGTFKSLLRKLMSVHPGSIWSDWVGEVTFAMNALVSRPHGHTPFRLVYK